MEQRLTLLTVGVKDLAGMRDFYENVFGWKPEVASEGIVMYKLNGFLLGFFPERALAEDAGVSGARSGFKPFSLAQNLRTKEDVDRLVASLKSKGMKVVKEPQEVFWGGYHAYLADPEENLWEIAYNPFMKYDAKGNVLGHDEIGGEA